MEWKRNARKFNSMNKTSQPAIVLSKSTTMQFEIGKFILREPFLLCERMHSIFHTHAQSAINAATIVARIRSHTHTQLPAIPIYLQTQQQHTISIIDFFLLYTENCFYLCRRRPFAWCEIIRNSTSNRIKRTQQSNTISTKQI